MATDLTNTSTPITADGDYEFDVVPGRPVVVKIDYTTPGTTADITIKDAQGGAYRNDDDSADLKVSVIATVVSTVTKFVVDPTGSKIILTAANFAGSPVAQPHVSTQY